MLLEAKLAQTFWKEAVAAAVCTINRAQLRVCSDKTPYELRTGRSTAVGYFKIFGSKCYIKINDDHLGKFHDRTDEGIFLGYSTETRAYKCYNKRLRRIVESIEVRVDEELPQDLSNHEEDEIDDDLSDEEQDVNEATENEESEKPADRQATSPVRRSSQAHKPSMKFVRRDHPEDLIIGNLDEGMKLRQTARKDLALMSLSEPKNFREAYEDEHWNKAMQDELEQIKKSETWELVSRPKDKNVIEQNGYLRTN